MGLYSNEVTLTFIQNVPMALHSHLFYSLSNSSNIFYKYLSPKTYKNLQACSCVQEPLLVSCFLPEERNTALKIELELFPAAAKPWASLGITGTSATRLGARESPIARCTVP